MSRGTQTTGTQNTGIEASGIVKRYGAALVLDDVTLSLPKGGVTAIIGANGAGKSTLLSVIARLVQPEGGRVTVDGMDVFHAPGAELAKRLAILRQENHLTARLSVRELVAFGRFPHSKGRITDADRAAVDHALDWMDLQPLAGRFLDELSGGQRQRAFVAMVLAQETDYLLLDEPLNNLDMKHGRAMMRLLARAARELGKTVVLVLHDINFAAAHADRIVAMREGKIQSIGSPAEIVTTESLAAIYEMDIAVEEVGGQRLALFYR